jgi:hypothetical protein
MVWGTQAVRDTHPKLACKTGGVESWVVGRSRAWANSEQAVHNRVSRIKRLYFNLGARFFTGLDSRDKIAGTFLVYNSRRHMKRFGFY